MLSQAIIAEKLMLQSGTPEVPPLYLTPYNLTPNKITLQTYFLSMPERAKKKQNLIVC